jgi:hypothetical protein
MNDQKKTALAVALATVIGAPTISSAAIINMTYDGWFTMLNTAGTDVLVNGDASGNAMYGRRTAISGTMAFDTVTGAGSATMVPFSFFGGRSTVATSISFQAIGDGAGGAGSLVLGNMIFNWGATTGIPTSIVLDASGFFGAVANGISSSDTITGAGSLAATDDFLFKFGKFSYTLPMGPVPMATTTFNTTNIGTVGLGSNPSGTLPLTDDGIGGSPMQAGAFPGFNANFDITSLHIIYHVDPIPIPAAIWLFGSGLMGLIGITRRKKAA